jgi:heme/copper-type cytochrome/quinol oxidase subunit 3
MRQRAQFGMALFLLSEAVFFFMLIAAFVYFRSSSLGAAAGNLNLPVTAVYTACLLASSITVQRAAGSGARWWLAGTIVLGAVFLFGQASEYFRLFRQNVTISQSVFGTTFFTLTGIHGLHVLGGIALLAIVLGLSAPRTAVETVAMYWHFVDGVWLVIFAVVYLWTFL